MLSEPYAIIKNAGGREQPQRKRALRQSPQGPLVYSARSGSDQSQTRTRR